MAGLVFDLASGWVSFWGPFTLDLVHRSETCVGLCRFWLRLPLPLNACGSLLFLI